MDTVDINFHECAIALQELLGSRLKTGLTPNRTSDARKLIGGLVAGAKIATVLGVPQLNDITRAIGRLKRQFKAWLDIVGQSGKAESQRRIKLDEIRNSITIMTSIMVGQSEILEVNATDSRLRRVTIEHFGRVAAACNIKGWPNVYVLGCFDHKRTVLTQQERAIWLSAAIVNSWHGEEPPRVAIVGGGIAGVTAAACLLLAGASVELLERTDELMSLQRRNTTRFVHPNLYDWPLTHANDLNANLPFLNWTAGLASEVVSQIEQGANSIFSSFDWSPTFDFDATDIHREIENGRRRYRISDKEGTNTNGDCVDIVIFAIGFGFENSRQYGVESPSYWDNEALHAAGRYTKSHQGEILVSGSGDGGLIDVLRGTFRDFRQESALEMFPELNSEHVCKGLLDIEKEAKESYKLDNHAYFPFQDRYNQLIGQHILPDIVKNNIKKSYRITFNTRNAKTYRLDSSILNRILVQYLIFNKNILVVPREISIDMIRRNVDPMEKAFSVDWGYGTPRNNYDRILLRHGVSSNHFQQTFPKLFKDCEHMAGFLSVLDLPTVLPQEVGKLIHSGFRNK